MVLPKFFERELLNYFILMVLRWGHSTIREMKYQQHVILIEKYRFNFFIYNIVKLLS